MTLGLYQGLRRHCHGRTSDRVDLAPLLYCTTLASATPQASALGLSSYQLNCYGMATGVELANRIPNLDASQIHSLISFFR